MRESSFCRIYNFILFILHFTIKLGQIPTSAKVCNRLKIYIFILHNSATFLRFSWQSLHLHSQLNYKSSTFCEKLHSMSFFSTNSTFTLIQFFYKPTIALSSFLHSTSLKKGPNLQYIFCIPPPFSRNEEYKMCN